MASVRRALTGTSSLHLSEPCLLTHGPEAHYGFPRLVRAANDDLLLFYRVGTTHACDDSVIAMQRSNDAGTTWSRERVLWRVDPGFSARNPTWREPR